LRRLVKAGQKSFIRTGDHTSPMQVLKSDLDSYIAAHRVPAKEAQGEGDATVREDT
jgi:hypothetical protein